MSKSTMLAAGAFFAALTAAGAAYAGPINVTTYHYDNQRTGWNQIEPGLTAKRVKSSQFMMLASRKLDDQVDAQPLVLGNQMIAGHGRHEVVYVATESNSIYALDANSGRILLQANFGPPIPYTSLPGSCNNNGPNIGINSTPTIDPATGTIYVMTDTLESGNAVYRIHALDPSTLTDTVPPVVVAATGVLSNGSTYHFNPYTARSRAALLVANGNVYAAFASYCDEAANDSRGWVLGWNLGSLTPLASNQLNDKRKHSTNDYFLSSVWMSGYGLAAGLTGDIYFVTGNSDPSGDSYDPVNNLTESVVQVSSDLSTVESTFTPMDPSYGWKVLDMYDEDFGSGGVMLLPPQPGSTTNMAVAAGKVGQMYLLNADDLTNGKANGGKAFAVYDIGGCWCGQSYYKDSDGVGRVVTSGGTSVEVWKVMTGGTKPRLVFKSQPGSVDDGQDPGFFTSISSNGSNKGTTVIWAVSRPTDSNPAHISLYAFDPDKNTTLFSGVAGSWPNTGGNSNIVPVVANGKVYVASDQTLAIFGLAAPGAKPASLPAPTLVDMRVKLALGRHEITGTVRGIAGNIVTLQKRNGEMVSVDASQAVKKFDFAQPWAGHGMTARGTLSAAGTMKADIVLHAKANPAMWQPDR